MSGDEPPFSSHQQEFLKSMLSEAVKEALVAEKDKEKEREKAATTEGRKVPPPLDSDQLDAASSSDKSE